jgi:plastocyanin
MHSITRQRGSFAFLGLIILAILFMFLAWWVRSPGFPLRSGNNPTPTDETKLIADGIKYRIEITNKGFVPGVVTVEPYDTVTFVNRDIRPHWPVAGDLEGELYCEEFGQGRQLMQNEAYAVVFKEEMECAFHDQLDESFSVGTIVVEKISSR